MSDIVNCYSGSSYPERPISFIWMDEEYTIKTIIKTWRIPYGKFFEVITTKDKIFQLFYNEQSNIWQIQER